MFENEEKKKKKTSKSGQYSRMDRQREFFGNEEEPVCHRFKLTLGKMERFGDEKG